MDFDRVLEKCGNFGRYQWVVLLLYGYTNIMSSMHYFSQTLISFTPDHWCYHPQLENKSYGYIEEIYKQYKKPQCTLLEEVVNGTVSVAVENGACQQWIYDRENNYESITTELNWVCDRAYQNAVGQSFYYIGACVGTIFFGFLADRIGRLPAVIMSTLTGGIGDFITSFVNNVTMYAVSRFISGLSTDTFFMLMYILVFEYLSPKRRTFGLNIIQAVFYCVGLMISPWYAIWVQSWRKYLLVASIPVLLVFVYPLLLSESANWLLTRKRYDRAVKCLKRVAKFNGRQVDEVVFEEFVDHYQQKMAEEEKLNNKDSFWGMFRTPRLRKFTIILLIKSVIITMAFDIVSRNMEGLGSSPFKLFSYTSIIYLPAGLTIIAFQNIIGRKGMASASLLVGGIITAITGFLIAFLDPKSNAILLAIMVGLGRFGAVVAYDAEVQYCTEIIPTSVRGRGVANIHLNWVCDRAYQNAVGQSFYYIGACVGTIFFGFLADRIGRLPAVIMSTLTGGIGDFITSFVNNVTMYAVSRFISGLSTDTFFMLMYILVFEYLSPKRRTFGLNIIQAVFYCVGLMISPWYAIWVQSWRKYLLVASIPVLLVFVYPLLLSESANWLLTRKRYDRAVKCLKRVAKFNGRQVDEVVFEEFVDHYQQKMAEEEKLNNKDSFWGMFRTPRLRKFTIILLIKSVIITMAFDIVSRNMEGLGSSPFKLFSYTSIIYLPAGLTIIAFQNIIGRKGMASASLLVGGIITAITGFLIAFLDPKSNAILLAIMVGLGRFGAVVAYDAEVQYCTEIIPTSVRGRGVANIHVIGYACSFLNSYVIYLGTFYRPLPSIFISVIMLVGAALCLCLPETLNKKLPETLSDGEVFGLNEKWYYFPCFSRKPKNTENLQNTHKKVKINSKF